MKAEGVEYFRFDGAPGEFFACAPYRARLSVASCASRWQEAQTIAGRDAYRFEKCRGCAIGARHAGQEVVEYSPWYQADICPRCGVGTTRMIGGTRCISCYNREREFLAGKNAKGTRPTMAPLERRTIRYAVKGGAVRTLTVDYSADMTELAIQVLRTTRGRVLFGMNPASPVLRQGRLL